MTETKFCPMRATQCNENCGMYDPKLHKCVIFGINSNFGVISRELTTLNNRLQAYMNYLINKKNE